MNLHRSLTVTALGASALLCATAGCDSSTDDTAAGGAGGSGDCPCYPCGVYALESLTERPAGAPKDVICADSLPVMDALNKCVCGPAGGDCQSVCAATCALELDSGGAGPGGAGQGGAAAGGDSADCIACQAAAVEASAPCLDEWNACVELSECPQ